MALQSASASGKFIVVAVFVTILFSMDVSVGAVDFRVTAQALFVLQVGLLLASVGLSIRRPSSLKRSVLSHPMLLLWLALFLLALSGAITKVYTWEIVKRVVLILFPRVLLISAVLLDRTPSATFWLMARAFVILMIFSVLLGALTLALGQLGEVATLTFGPLQTEIPVFRYQEFIRFTAPIGHGNPNNVAALLFTSIMLTIGLVMIGYWSRILGGSLLGLQVLAFLATLSRTSWLSLAPSLIVLFILATRRMSNAIVRVAGISVFAIPASVIILNFSGSLSIGIEKTLERGFSGRDAFWTLGLDLFNRNVGSGVGFGMTKEFVSHLSGAGGGFHNAYLQQAVELGLPGLVLLLGIIALAFVLGLCGLQRERKRFIVPVQKNRKSVLSAEAITGAVGVATIVAISINSLGESYIFLNHAIGVLWTYILGAVSCGCSPGLKLMRSRKEARPVNT